MEYGISKYIISYLREIFITWGINSRVIMRVICEKQKYWGKSVFLERNDRGGGEER